MMDDADGGKDEQRRGTMRKARNTDAEASNKTVASLLSVPVLLGQRLDAFLPLVHLDFALEEHKGRGAAPRDRKQLLLALLVLSAAAVALALCAGPGAGAKVGATESERPVVTGG